MKAFKYYLHIPSGQRLAGEIRGLRTELGLPPGKPPHLTIVPPYRGNSGLFPGSEMESMLKQRLSLFVRQLKRPTIKPIGFNVFDNGRTLIVAIRKTRELQLCFESCLEAFRPHINNLDQAKIKMGYNPHITIADDLDPAIGRALRDKLRSSDQLPEPFVPSVINLLRSPSDDTKWVTLGSMLLASE